MNERQHKRISLGQNFLKSPKLVADLVGMADIRSSDTVYEIGPGTGIITAELARRAERVVAVEKDAALVGRLRKRFRAADNVEIVRGDFLAFAVGARRYKIFASVPFNITARLMRKILHERPAPREAFLVLQKEAARKYAGIPRETEASLLAKPMFEFEVLRSLRRADFEPVPAVDSVMLRVRRRDRPLLGRCDHASYNEFVRFGFGRWKRNLRLAFKDVFAYRRWKRLARELRFPLDATPTELTFEQWLGLHRACIDKTRRPRGDVGEAPIRAGGTFRGTFPPADRNPPSTHGETKHDGELKYAIRQKRGPNGRRPPACAVGRPHRLVHPYPAADRSRGFSY